MIATPVVPPKKRSVPVDVYDAAVRVYVRGRIDDVMGYAPVVRTWAEGKLDPLPEDIEMVAYWVICAAIRDGIARGTANDTERHGHG